MSHTMTGATFTLLFFQSNNTVAVCIVHLLGDGMLLWNVQ